jgi:hypothetical protein
VSRVSSLQRRRHKLVTIAPWLGHIENCPGQSQTFWGEAANRIRLNDNWRQIHELITEKVPNLSEFGLWITLGTGKVTGIFPTRTPIVDNSAQVGFSVAG